MWSLVGADGQKWSISMFVSATFLIIIKRLMSHKFMIKIFLISFKFNANQNIWVIIDMTHESLKMTEDGAGAKVSNWPFSISSANKWPCWPLVSTVICRSKWILLNVIVSRGNHDHLLAPEAKNSHFVKTALAPFLVIFNDSWVISIMTHTFLSAFKFILFKNICIMNLWLMSSRNITANGVKSSDHIWPRKLLHL